MEGESVRMMQSYWIPHRLNDSDNLFAHFASRSQYMTRRTSRANAWTSLLPARTSWSVAWTMFAHWRWSVERKSRTDVCCEGEIMQIVTVAVVWCFLMFLCMCVLCWAAGQVMNTPATVGNSSSWREETTLAGKHGVAATLTMLRDWCPSDQSAVLWVSPPVPVINSWLIVHRDGDYHGSRMYYMFLWWYLQNHKESKIVVFERENFIGRQWEMADDFPSLQAMGWPNNEIGSMQVQSGAWVSCSFILSYSLFFFSFHFLLFPKKQRMTFLVIT